MIELLNSGLSVVALLDLITWRLDRSQSPWSDLPVGFGRGIWASREVGNDCS